MKTDRANSLKHAAEDYVNLDLSDDGSIHDTLHPVNNSLVICRKPHQCKMCNNIIESGSRAVRVTELIHCRGYQSEYVCLPCVEKRLESKSRDRS